MISKMMIAAGLTVIPAILLAQDTPPVRAVQPFACDGQQHILASGKPTITFEFQFAGPVQQQTIMFGAYETGTFKGANAPLQPFELQIDGKTVAHTNISFDPSSGRIFASLSNVLPVDAYVHHYVVITGNIDNIPDVLATGWASCVRR